VVNVIIFIAATGRNQMNRSLQAERSRSRNRNENLRLDFIMLTVKMI